MEHYVKTSTVPLARTSGTLRKNRCCSIRSVRKLDYAFVIIFIVDVFQKRLHSQNLGKPEVIDFLTIDVESAEMYVVGDFNFKEFDIRVILFEVSAGTRWMEIDMILLRNNFVKVL